MPQQSIRRINLYDFFSVLLPGLAFLFGIYPLLPFGFNLSPIGAVLSSLVIGFVIGRVIHTIATSLHQWFSNLDSFNINTHREDFIQEIRETNYLPEGVVDEFYRECRRAFVGIDLRYHRDYEDNEEDSEILDALYMCVRSYTHIGSQGPSENFQAIYAFSRSMWLVMVALFTLYLIAGIDLLLRDAGFGVTDFSYTPTLTVVDVPIALTIVIAILFSGSLIRVFWTGVVRYKKIYISYVITDFIALRNSERSE